MLLDDLILTGISDLTSAEVNQLKNINASIISTTQWNYISNFDQNLSTTNDVVFNSIVSDGIEIKSNNIKYNTNTTGLNKITIPVNLNDALSITDGINDYMQFKSTTSFLEINLTQNTTVSGDIKVSGNITSTGTVNGRNISTDGSTLDNLNITLGLGSLTVAEINQLKNINTSIISINNWGYLSSMDQSTSSTSDVSFASLVIDEISMNNSSITFTGSNNSNIISIPDNLTSSLSIMEGSTSYIVIYTDDGNEKINILKNIDITGNITLNGTVNGRNI